MLPNYLASYVTITAKAITNTVQSMRPQNISYWPYTVSSILYRRSRIETSLLRRDQYRTTVNRVYCDGFSILIPCKRLYVPATKQYNYIGSKTHGAYN